MSRRIVCIKKDNGNHSNPHEAVSHYGWLDESSNDSNATVTPRTIMVGFVENGGEAYVKDSNGNIAYCRVRTSVNGTKFLQTYSDNTPTDNLLSLRECRV